MSAPVTGRAVHERYICTMRSTLIVSQLCWLAALSDDGKMVVLDGWTHVKPLFWPPLLPTTHIRIISFVHLTQTAGAWWSWPVALLATYCWPLT